jgi:DNA-binding NtrC family response regulator
MNKRHTVLVIENDSMVGAMLRMALERRGYLALLAQNGREAADLSHRHRTEIDLVVCDVVLWGESGQSVAADVCGLSPLAKVLFISVVPLGMLCEQGLLSPWVFASSSARFLQKPFLPSEMVDILSNMLASDRNPAPAIQGKASHALAR